MSLKSKSITLVNAYPGYEQDKELPLGLLYLAAVLEQQGCRVELRDYQLCDGASYFDVVNFVHFLDGCAPVVGISCMADSLPLVVAATRQLKEQRPDLTIVLGGPGPTGACEPLLAAFPHIDVVVRGEGEETLVELLEALDRGELERVAGISYVKSGYVHHNRPRGRLQQLDHLPWPAYSYVRWDCYGAARISTSRGCPFGCTFCDVPGLWGRRVVERSLDSVFQEIEELYYRYGQHHIQIYDDTFVVNRGRVLDFCRGLRSRGLKLTWNCFGRIDLMDGELMAEMAEAGCNRIYYGIESGSPRVLGAIGKGFHPEQAEAVLKESVKFFDIVVASYIWGFPFEDLDDFRHTVSSIARVACLSPKVFVQRHLLTPTHLSAVYTGNSGRLRPLSELPLQLPDPLLNLSFRDYQQQGQDVIMSMIEAHPEVFPGYYFYNSPDIDTKVSDIAQSQRFWRQLASRFLMDEEFRQEIIRTPEGVLQRLGPNPEVGQLVALTDLLQTIKVFVATGKPRYLAPLYHSLSSQDPLYHSL